jgi:hypothetical protein
MLEKLLGSRSFGTTMGHLARHKIILIVFSGGLGLPLVVRHVTFTFLGYWALIIPALVFHSSRKITLLFLM